MTGWDAALIAVVSLMGTAVAYVRDPEHKAFVLMLPVPFTLATLALGRPVDATNVLGMGVLFCFSLGVWTLRVRLRFPILAAIGICAAAYCAAGAGIAALPPAGDAAFWLSVIATLGAAAALVRLLPYREEPRYRTALPVWIKLPAIALVIFVVVAIKHRLGGFMTMFPMVGVVAAYEARNSLWTIVRRIPWFIIVMTPMIAVIRLSQDRLGLPRALALGWPVFLTLLWLLRTHYTGGPRRGRQCADGYGPPASKTL